MRAFVAISIPPAIAERLAGARFKLIQTRAAVRWLPPAQFHVTVKFLADLPENLVAEVQKRITAAATEVPAFTLQLEGLGKFPERGPARAIISRVISPDHRIMKLHRLIDSSLAGIGLPLDMRVLFPHVTLGRVQSNNGVNRLLRLLVKHDLDELGEFTAERVTLYGSELGVEGVTHTALHTAKLAKAAPPGGPTGKRPQ